MSAKYQFLLVFPKTQSFFSAFVFWTATFQLPFTELPYQSVRFRSGSAPLVDWRKLNYWIRSHSIHSHHPPLQSHDHKRRMHPRSFLAAYQSSNPQTWYAIPEIFQLINFIGLSRSSLESLTQKTRGILQVKCLLFSIAFLIFTLVEFRCQMGQQAKASFSPFAPLSRIHVFDWQSFLSRVFEKFLESLLFSARRYCLKYSQSWGSSCKFVLSFQVVLEF